MGSEFGHHIKSLTILEDWRSFKSGFKIIFHPGINLIVGDQGTGKSSLLHLISEEKNIGMLLISDALHVNFYFISPSPHDWKSTKSIIFGSPILDFFNRSY